MVAPTSAASSYLLSPVVERLGFGPVTFTVADTLDMVAQGILPEDSSVELLNGVLVYRDRFDLKEGEIVAGAQHDFVVTALSKLSLSIDNDSRHLRTQATLVCSERHAPIPDAFVLRGGVRDYTDRLPAASDAWCVIEVAGSSYERDAGEKLAGYARASIPQYVIVNLNNRTAEIYTNPDPAAGTYAAPQVVHEGQSLSLRIGESEFFTFVLGGILP